METLTALLVEYKYWVVIAGALLEGEVVLLLAGAAAYYGQMSLSLVMLISFLGAMFHDHLLFFLGRYLGRPLLARYPKLREKSKRVLELFHKYQNKLILSFRFIYGLRTVTPIIIGTSDITLKRYSSLTMIAALIWAITISYLGYAFAAAIQVVMDYFQQGQKVLAVILVCLIIIGFGVYKLKYAFNKR